MRIDPSLDSGLDFASFFNGFTSNTTRAAYTLRFGDGGLPGTRG